MAQTDIHEQSLSDLLSIQQQLIRNTDEINAGARAAGTLTGNFKEARKVAEGLNSSLRAAAAIQSDSNKSYFTSLQVSRNIKNLANELTKISQAKVAHEANLTLEGKLQLQTYRDQLKAQEDAIANQSRLNTELAAGNLEKGRQKTIQREITKSEQLGTALVAAIAVSKNKIAVLETRMYEEAEKTAAAAVAANAAYKDSTPLLQKMALTAKELGDRLSKTDLGKGLMKGLGIGTAAEMFQSLVQTAFKLESSLTSISKSSGTTAEFSKQLGDNYNSAMVNVHMLNTNLDKSLLTLSSQLQAQQELQASSGQMALFTEKNVQDQLYLTKQLGLQADEAAGIQKLAMFTEKSTSETTDALYEQVAASNKMNGLRTSGKEIMVAVSKVEGMLAANYKNNPKLIAAAVVQAKALGMSLEQAANASNSMLDFESSIANELEAELLTGKKWNLEKARSLALEGDSAGAMREMLVNVGSYSDFMKQNVIARQAEAKAIGMTADELANSLRTTELMKKVSKETTTAIAQSGEAGKYNAQLNAATNATEMQAAEKRVAKQIEFEASMEKVRDAMGQMASGPLLALVDFMKMLTENAMIFKGVLIATAAVMAAIATSSLVTAFGMTAATGGLNLAGGVTVGAIAAITAGAAAVAVNYKPVSDGLISPSGQIMISTPEGMIKPSKNDSIITTTNPGALLGGGGGGKSEQLLSSILAAVQQPGGVYINADKVGTTLGMSYNAYA